jgi:hypothetical protein
MGELAQTPQAQRSAAADALKKREDGFRAKGAQEGRAAEKAELIKRFGQAVFDQFSLLETMKAEMRAQFEREEAKHGKAAYWRSSIPRLTPQAASALSLTSQRRWCDHSKATAGARVTRTLGKT